MRDQFNLIKEHHIENERCLNYVWINKDRFVERDGQVQCGVPLHYIDRAVENACRYPDTDVNIWLDYDLLDDRSIDIASAHIAKSGLSNIKLQNLQNIPDYAERKHTLFDPERDLSEVRTFEREKTFEDENIWGRVDLARLMVIQHCLEQADARDVVYADFDVEDVQLNSPIAQERLDEIGMVFGSSKPGIIENGYMAFRSDRMDMQFFESLVTKTEEEVAAGYNGYGPFYQELKSWCEERSIVEYPDSICFPVLHPMRHAITKPPDYEGICIG